jgi:hypothetical protein
MQLMKMSALGGTRKGWKGALTLSAWLLLAAASGPVSAGSTWIWVDAGGRKVFSDTPPPASVSDRQILQRPGTPPLRMPDETEPAAKAPDTGAGQAKTAAPAKTDGDKKPGSEQAAAEAQRKAIEAKNAEIRADNCKRAQAALGTLNSGMRLMTTDESGKQVIMTESARTAETTRIQQIIQDNCR